jgi:hypothetical protein
VPVGVVSLKPGNLSFEEAAAVPMAATTALQGLRHHGQHPQPGAGPLARRRPGRRLQHPDVTGSGPRFDRILDTVGNRSVSGRWTALRWGL